MHSSKKNKKAPFQTRSIIFASQNPQVKFSLSCIKQLARALARSRRHEKRLAAKRLAGRKVCCQRWPHIRWVINIEWRINLHPTLHNRTSPADEDMRSLWCRKGGPFPRKSASVCRSVRGGQKWYNRNAATGQCTVDRKRGQSPTHKTKTRK